MARNIEYTLCLDKNIVTHQNPLKFIESKMVFINLKWTVLILTRRQEVIHLMQGVEGLLGLLVVSSRSAIWYSLYFNFKLRYSKSISKSLAKMSN
jgi:hypothetical protein